MARGDVRIAVTLACEECKRRNYQTEKSKRNDPDRIEFPQVLPLVRPAHAAQGDPLMGCRFYTRARGLGPLWPAIARGPSSARPSAGRARLAEEQAAGGPPDEAESERRQRRRRAGRAAARPGDRRSHDGRALAGGLARAGGGRPAQDEGHSDAIFGHRPGVAPPTAEQELDEQEALQEIEDWEVDDPDAAEKGAGEEGYEARGRRGREDAEAHKHRSRVVQFLIAVWAELQRVQWPNRQALVTLTGVVLGFVLIAGGYLGLLDAIFSELIQASSLGKMFRWYAVNTYSGHENKVKQNLEHRRISLGQENSIRQIVVPTEQVQELKDGQKIRRSSGRCPATCS